MLLYNDKTYSQSFNPYFTNFYTADTSSLFDNTVVTDGQRLVKIKKNYATGKEGLLSVLFNTFYYDELNQCQQPVADLKGFAIKHFRLNGDENYKTWFYTCFDHMEAIDYVAYSYDMLSESNLSQTAVVYTTNGEYNCNIFGNNRCLSVMDSTGYVLWSKCEEEGDHPYRDVLFSKETNNPIYIVGQSENPNSPGVHNIVIKKYNSSTGTLLFTKILLDDDNQIIPIKIIEENYSNTLLILGKLNLNGSSDYFPVIYRIDKSTMNILWAKEYRNFNVNLMTEIEPISIFQGKDPNSPYLNTDILYFVGKRKENEQVAFCNGNWRYKPITMTIDVNSGQFGTCYEWDLKDEFSVDISVHPTDMTVNTGLEYDFQMTPLGTPTPPPAISFNNIYISCYYEPIASCTTLNALLVLNSNDMTPNYFVRHDNDNSNLNVQEYNSLVFDTILVNGCNAYDNRLFCTGNMQEYNWPAGPNNDSIVLANANIWKGENNCPTQMIISYNPYIITNNDIGSIDDLEEEDFDFELQFFDPTEITKRVACHNNITYPYLEDWCMSAYKPIDVEKPINKNELFEKFIFNNYELEKRKNEDRKDFTPIYYDVLGRKLQLEELKQGNIYIRKK